MCFQASPFLSCDPRHAALRGPNPASANVSTTVTADLRDTCRRTDTPSNMKQCAKCELKALSEDIHGFKSFNFCIYITLEPNLNIYFVYISYLCPPVAAKSHLKGSSVRQKCCDCLFFCIQFPSKAKNEKVLQSSEFFLV